ncbi:MAG: beta-galactosidase [Clostridiales bacterium]|nr:beta-galactosidase [Clostridiales bacterium]
MPRMEHPQPQFERKNWMNLNGEWDFEFDLNKSGRDRKLYENGHFILKIIVPFCPQSRLSGMGYTDFINSVWYSRTVNITKEQLKGRILLHFGAVDYESFVYVNGELAGTHKGGYTSFEFDVTKLLREGENSICLCAEDNERDTAVPSGKQSYTLKSQGCFYTRTTGIWQTVWLEWTNQVRVRSVKITPNVFDFESSVLIEAEFDGDARGCTFMAEALFDGEYESEGIAAADSGRSAINLLLEADESKFWSPGHGNLYDLKLTLEKDGVPIDCVNSYFGLRTISFNGKKCLINGKSVFQRLVLDQGFYPDGVYTAPTDEELKGDILRSMALGFNGARLHQKVFEQRFLYWADRLGYLCWGEFPSWGIDPKDAATPAIFLDEWLQVLRRDYNAPCIVGWCPWNETWGENNSGARDATMRLSYLVTKAFDPTRPCIDASGGTHALTDIFDAHDYTQDPAVYAERYAPGKPFYDHLSRKERDVSLPVFISEYGGIGWNPDGEGWGYGDGPKTEEEFIARYRGLTDALLNNPDHMGFCYTQLTDVEQERNGLYYYDRRPKFDPAIFKEINTRKAAIEE